MAIDLDARDRRGRTPLHTAVITRDIRRTAQLLQAGANPNIKDKLGSTGHTPLWYAVTQTRDPKTVELLKNAKATTDALLFSELLRQSNADPINRDLRDIRKLLSSELPHK